MIDLVNVVSADGRCLIVKWSLCSVSRLTSTSRVASCLVGCDIVSLTTTSTGIAARCSTNEAFSTNSTSASEWSVGQLCSLSHSLCVYVSLLYFCVNCVICVFLQYFDAVGWVFWPVKTVARITYTVLVETLNHAQSINLTHSVCVCVRLWCVYRQHTLLLRQANP